jgi:hypothetical protein
MGREVTDPNDEDWPMTRAEKRTWKRFLDHPVAHSDYEPFGFVLKAKAVGHVDALAFGMLPSETLDVSVQITREDITMPSASASPARRCWSARLSVRSRS